VCVCVCVCVSCYLLCAEQVLSVVKPGQHGYEKCQTLLCMIRLAQRMKEVRLFADVLRVVVALGVVFLQASMLCLCLCKCMCVWYVFISFVVVVPLNRRGMRASPVASSIKPLIHTQLHYVPLHLQTTDAWPPYFTPIVLLHTCRSTGADQPLGKRCEVPFGTDVVCVCVCVPQAGRSRLRL